jgi:hypothetical protein
MVYEWYWNKLPKPASPWHLGPDDDDDEPNLATFREFADRTNHETAKPQEDCGGPVSGAQAAPRRAPPKERTVPIGTTRPNPGARVNRIL